MTITLFRRKGPLVRDGYQIERCSSPRTALDQVDRVFWPVKWKYAVKEVGGQPAFGPNPVIALNNEFNKNGYWFLDYWDANWPLFTNEGIAKVLQEHFEGESCEAPTGDKPALRVPAPRPYRVSITNMSDERVIKYFDSVNAIGEQVRQWAFINGGAKGRDAIDKLNSLDDQLAVFGWEYNGPTTKMHWVGRAFAYLTAEANLDDFETRLLEGLHAFVFEKDHNANVLRDLLINGPIAQD